MWCSYAEAIAAMRIRLSPAQYARWLDQGFECGLAPLGAKLKRALVEFTGVSLDAHRQPVDPVAFEPVWAASWDALQQLAAEVDAAWAAHRAACEREDREDLLDFDEQDPDGRMMLVDYLHMRAASGSRLAQLTATEFYLLVLACLLHDTEHWRACVEVDAALAHIALAARMVESSGAVALVEEARLSAARAGGAKRHDATRPLTDWLREAVYSRHAQTPYVTQVEAAKDLEPDAVAKARELGLGPGHFSYHDSLGWVTRALARLGFSPRRRA
ncbi:hypothetical protein [Jeongeupia naejangsanensis]|uniref:Uncharacterized protein n=1 Tax=Jeongeupia naejangsanensis TaxID=613195 RepID=A0ABS2BKC4_9NEIS|nr:hypothetical protein [Jeongeupia naejangsanensis]MBM3116062.1 hypothetical protein [Jeongeupia naejangsanensis]